MRRPLLALFLVLALPAAAAAQITPTFTFTAGTVISPDEMNTNFALFSQALNRAGGTMTGTLNSRQITPTSDATYDVGTSGAKFRDAFLSRDLSLGRNATIGGDLALTGNASITGNVSITGTLSAGGGGLIATSVSCTGCIDTTQLATTGVSAGSSGSATSIPTLTVDARGRVTALGSATPQLTLSSTYFSSLSGVNLTNLPEASVTGTSLLARLGSSQSITGTWTFSTNPVFNSAGISWGSVSKSGSSLADLATRSAADLSSGTLPDARFPSTLPAVSGANLTSLIGAKSTFSADTDVTFTKSGFVILVSSSNDVGDLTIAGVNWGTVNIEEDGSHNLWGPYIAGQTIHVTSHAGGPPTCYFVPIGG